jgi:hypothetical protein
MEDGDNTTSQKYSTLIDVPSRLVVVSGSTGRRRWSAEMKARIVAEWIGRRQRDRDTRSEFLYTHGDLEEGSAECLERRLAPRQAAGRGLAKLMKNPIGAGVEEEPELVDLPAVAGCAVGFVVELVLLDHFSIWPRAQ